MGRGRACFKILIASSQRHPAITAASIRSARPAGLPTVSHLFFFIFEFGVDFLSFIDELAGERRCGVRIIGGLEHFTFERNFPLGNFGGVAAVQFVQLFLLFRSELGGGRGLVKTLHGDFVGGFHKG